jgi:hypothetical protein
MDLFQNIEKEGFKALTDQKRVKELMNIVLKTL